MFLNKLKEKLDHVAKKAEEQIEYMTSDESEKRIEICRSCEHLIPSIMQCKKCGCLMKFKTRIKTARCPVDKW